MSIPSSELCFLVTLYKEIELCKWTISNIREHHKDSHIICISDGVEHSSMPSFSIDMSIIYEELPHLKTLETGGLWVDRYINYYLSHSDKPYLIKLDPDTGVHRPINHLCSSDIFGTFNNNYLDTNSCCFTRHAATIITSSNYLSDDRYNIDNEYIYRDKYKRRKPSTDRAIRHVIDRLGLSLTRWSEVRSTQGYSPNLDLTYALTHPNADMSL
jgi:hypothetical protein